MATAPRIENPDFSKVHTFVLFVGYPRSGHSLIGSMIDAHPNAIIAHEVPLIFVLPFFTSFLERKWGGGMNVMLFYFFYYYYSLTVFFLSVIQFDVLGKLDNYTSGSSEEGKLNLWNDLFKDSKEMAYSEGGRQHNNYKFAPPLLTAKLCGS